jgi:hypothetical protein
MSWSAESLPTLQGHCTLPPVTCTLLLFTAGNTTSHNTNFPACECSFLQACFQLRTENGGFRSGLASTETEKPHEILFISWKILPNQKRTVAIKWLTLLLRIRKAPGSNLRTEASYPENVYMAYYRVHNRTPLSYWATSIHHILQSCTFMVHFNIILPPILTTPKSEYDWFLKTAVFWVVASCSLVEVCRRHLHSWLVGRVKTQTQNSATMCSTGTRTESMEFYSTSANITFVNTWIS